MRSVRYSVAVSLDGYIAGPNGESDWIVMDPEVDFRAMMAEFDTVLIGRKTYDAMRAYSGGGIPGMKVYVFSETLSPADHPGVVVSTDPFATVTELKQSPGKDIWLFGGGELFRSMLALGIVDSVEVAIIPVLLGAGLRLLPEMNQRTGLELKSHRVYPKTGRVRLAYGVAPRGVNT